jgi:uncharacterized membrane protein YphA (DoxX/SURF4 family)
VNIPTLAAGVVGAVFVYAGVAKILAGRKWPASARNLGIPPVVASSVMLGEVVIGLGVVLGDAWRTEFLGAAALLLTAFTGLLGMHLWRDNRPPCACFGGASQRPIGARDIARNIFLLALVFVAIAS